MDAILSRPEWADVVAILPENTNFESEFFLDFQIF